MWQDIDRGTCTTDLLQFWIYRLDIIEAFKFYGFLALFSLVYLYTF